MWIQTAQSQYGHNEEKRILQALDVFLLRVCPPSSYSSECVFHNVLDTSVQLAHSMVLDAQH